MSAVAVLFWHYQHFAYDSDTLVNFSQSKQPLFYLFKFFYQNGAKGVQIFWCISGFIFFWKYTNQIASKNVSAYNFFILRFSRLYPLHLATLLLVAGLQIWHLRLTNSYFVYQNNDQLHFILQIFMASNWGFMEKGDSFNGPIWSISLEVLIYGLFFLVVRLFGTSLLVSIGVLTLCLLAKFFSINYQAIDCAAYFFIGGITALLSQLNFIKNHKYMWGAIGIIYLIFIAVFYTSSPPIIPKNLANFALLGALPITLYIFAYIVKVPELFRSRIELGGTLTYSSYLLHFPITLCIVIGYKLVGVEIQYQSWHIFLAYFGITLTLAGLTYRYFELPAQNFLRKKFIFSGP